jgi:hypothetical protein
MSFKLMLRGVQRHGPVAVADPRVSRKGGESQILSWAGNLPLLRRPKIPYCAHKNSLLENILSQMNPINTPIYKIHCTIIMPYKPSYDEQPFPFTFQALYASDISFVHATCSDHLILLHMTIVVRANYDVTSCVI